MRIVLIVDLLGIYLKWLTNGVIQFIELFNISCAFHVMKFYSACMASCDTLFEQNGANKAGLIVIGVTRFNGGPASIPLPSQIETYARSTVALVKFL